ncbi:MAG: hypothetical protein G01um101425_1038 [Candidatus Peregrinibacteria bacterium Gr01-1014_25]|nr:MAG: hypothetical protein G01um101425_1038 [Candidatus Peregrinibacteria bacterium Gr01-1014_25]
MTSLLFATTLAALFSLTSLLVILLRVSPLTAPLQALPAFFISIFLAVTACCGLALYSLWKHWRGATWGEGHALSVGLREGVFLGAIAVIIILFHILGILTWWVVAWAVAIFLSIELALHS